MMRVRSALLWGAAAATAAAVLWAPAPDEDSVQPVARAQRIASMATATVRKPRAEEVLVLELRPRDGDKEPPQLFRDHKPAQPPRSAPAAVPEFRGPPAPTVPPLPFKVIGQLVEDGRVTVFLQHNEQSLVARSGDVLLDQYRVEQVGDAGMVLTFLPLNQRQTLELTNVPK